MRLQRSRPHWLIVAMMACATLFVCAQAAAASLHRQPLLSSLPEAPPPKQACIPQAPLRPVDVFASSSFRLGVQDNRLIIADSKNVGQYIDGLASLGIRVARVDVRWWKYQPTPPVGLPYAPKDPSFRWKRLDRIFRGMAYCGITPIVNFYEAPPWANGRPYKQDAAGRRLSEDVFERAYMPDVNAFGNFVFAFARRYNGSFAVRMGKYRLTYPRVGVFEVYNEPNNPRFLPPQWVNRGKSGWFRQSPSLYAALLRKAYEVAHYVQNDPANPPVVIGISGFSGGSPCAPKKSPGKGGVCVDDASASAEPGVALRDFLAALAKPGYQPPMDVAAIHLYTALAPMAPTPAFPSFATLSSQVIPMIDAIRPGVPIAITEFGWTTSPTPVRPSYVSEAQQASYFNQAIQLFATQPRIKLVSWFGVQDHPGWTSGLRRQDGSSKPVEAAFRQTLSQFR